MRIAGYGGVLTLQYATIFQYVFWLALIAFVITLIVGLMTCRIPKTP